MIPTTSSSLQKVVERETDVTKDTVHPTNNGSTKFVQPLVVQIETPIPNSEPVAALVIEPVVAPVSALKPNQKPSIPYPSRHHDQNLRDKANDQKEKIFQIFKDLDFNISFADALILMPKFRPTIKRMDECLALFDLGASINLMPLSVWNKISLPELSPTCMTLELSDRSISHPVGVAEDVFVKVGTFHFSADFIVVDFDADPRPSEVELKDLPTHLEYTFLEDDDKMPVIIAKDMSVEEKAALIKVLKSHKQAITWKLSDIKGINPEFYTHKILMEDDFKPAVQHKRRVNLKIYDVIKKEVENLFDVGLIYPISDSPWVSPVHCVPKKVVLPLLKMRKTSQF
nr:reverse transcriptase domain-containing protein [Tanacetum cinerariifolium]